MFKKNIGTSGRVIRFIFGMGLLFFAIWQKSWIFFLLALFSFFEALMSWCVVYQLLGKNSCPHDLNKK